MNELDYFRDSLRMERLYDAEWEFINRKIHDSLYYTCQEILTIGDRLLAHRYDSALYEIYAFSHVGIANYWSFTGKLDEALHQYHLAIDLIREKFGPYHIRLTELYVFLSGFYARAGDFDSAIQYQLQNLHIATKAFPEGHQYIANIYQNLTIYAARKGDVEKTRYYSSRMAGTTREVNPKRLPMAYLLQAQLCLDVGETGTAERSLALARKYQYGGSASSIDERRFDTFYGSLLGALQNDKGASENAITVLEELLINHLRLEDQAGFYQVLLAADRPLPSPIDFLYYIHSSFASLGDAYADLGRPQLALGAYRRSLETIREQYRAFQPQVNIEISRKMAAVHFQQGECRQALQVYQELLHELVPSVADDNYFENPELTQIAGFQYLIPLVLDKAWTLEKLFREDRDVEARRAAEQTYELAIAHLKHVRKYQLWESSRRHLADEGYPVLERAIAFFLARYEDDGNNDYLEKAFALMEMGKASTLLDFLHDQEALAGGAITNALLQEERRFRMQLTTLEKQLNEENNKPERDSLLVFSIEAELTRVKEGYEQFVDRLEEEHPAYFHRKYSPQAVTVEKVQEQLEAHTVLVEYFLGDSLLVALAVSPSGVAVHRSTADASFFEDLEVVTGALSGAPESLGEDFKERLFRLSQKLLPPSIVDPALEHLIIIPDHRLAYLPFELLLTEEPSSRDLPFLFKNYAVRYRSAASLVFGSSSSRGKVRESYLGFAPDYEGQPLAMSGADTVVRQFFPDLCRDDLIPLTFNQSEVAEAAAAWQGQAVTGGLATEQAFKEKAPNGRILHLAMHAFTTDEDPRYSFFAFAADTAAAEDGYLYAYELQHLDLQAELVVLSACNTGAGKVQRGEGVMSLARAFQYAGCPNVVMSLWPANDASTQKIISAFFRHLKAGQPKDQALRHAKLDFLADPANVEYGHPFFWAGFVLVGDGGALTLVRPGAQRWFWGIALAALLLAGLGLTMRKGLKKGPA